MKQAFLAPIANSPLLALPLFALFLFVVVFAAWVIRTYAKRPEAYAEVAALPLCDDEARLVQKNPTGGFGAQDARGDLKPQMFNQGAREVYHVE